MTENKRFTYLDASRNKYIGSFFCNGIPLTNPEVVDLLNENRQLKQENDELKKENQGIQNKVIKLWDFVEVKQCVTRTEIKKWWNDD